MLANHRSKCFWHRDHHTGGNSKNRRGTNPKNWTKQCAHSTPGGMAGKHFSPKYIKVFVQKDFFIYLFFLDKVKRAIKDQSHCARCRCKRKLQREKNSVERNVKMSGCVDPCCSLPGNFHPSVILFVVVGAGSRKRACQ